MEPIIRRIEAVDEVFAKFRREVFGIAIDTQDYMNLMRYVQNAINADLVVAPPPSAQKAD